MIKPAQLYSDVLKVKFWEIAHDEAYMFANDGYFDGYAPSNNTWGEHEFVSVSKDGEVLGYIKYCLNQRSWIASGLFAVNFSTSITFGRDLFKVIDDIFCKYKYKKLRYGVFIGNPIEKTYDRLTTKYGGRIVGVLEKDAVLMDGNYYDHKMYEIFRDDYLKRKKGISP